MINFDVVNPKRIININWTGKAVGKNKRLLHGRKGGMFTNPDYKKFMESLSETIKNQTDIVDLDNVNIIIKSRVHRSADHHNFITAILDGIQKSGLIKNDRNIEILVVDKPLRHGNGENDWFNITVEEL